MHARQLALETLARVLNGLEYAFREDPHARDVDGVRHDRELVAAEAGHHVAAAGGCRKSCRA